MALARALHEQKRLDEAEAAYDAILARNPDDAEALGFRGLLDFERGRLASASAFTERASRAAPENALYRARLGAICKTEGRLLQALDHYRRALTLNSLQPALLWHEIGNILFELGDDALACAAYRTVLQLNPNAAGALNNLGNALCNIANRTLSLEAANDAIASYRRVLSIAPKFAGIRRSIARAYIERARLFLLEDDLNGALNAVRDSVGYAGRNKRPKLVVALRQESAWKRDLRLPVRRLEKVRVLSGDPAWYLLTTDDLLYVDDMANANPEMSEYLRVSAANGRTILQLDTPRAEVKDASFLLGGSRNYYHWMLDYFPRLGIAEAAPSLPLLINRDLTRFQRECLDHLGIAETRLVSVAMPSIIQCAKLVAPLATCHEQELHPDAARWLRDKFIEPVPPKRRARIYVSRADAMLRRVVNEGELVAALRGLDFEIVVPGMITVSDQARAFSQAEIIIGPHGSGLTNIVFAPEGAHVVELSATRRRHPTFIEKLARGLHLNFHRVQGWALPTQEQRMAVNEQDQDMVVPVPELLRLITALGRGGAAN